MKDDGTHDRWSLHTFTMDVQSLDSSPLVIDAWEYSHKGNRSSMETAIMRGKVRTFTVLEMRDYKVFIEVGEGKTIFLIRGLWKDFLSLP